MLRLWSWWVALLASPALGASDGAATAAGDAGWAALVAALMIACAGCAALAWLSRLHHRRLVDSRAHYRNLVDLAEGYVAFRLVIDDQQRVVLELASRSVEKILGHPFEHYQADPQRVLAQLTHGERMRVLGELRLKALEGGAIRLNLELEHPRFAKPRHLMLHAVAAPNHAGQVWDGIIVDLTTEAEAEEERRNLTQQLELARRHESLGLLAGGVAHDFNNLLGAIRGNAELILPALGKDKVAGHRMTRLLMAVDRASGLVRQILAYTGKGAIEIKPVQLEHEIRGLKNLLKHSLPNQARMALEIEHGLPPVLIDPVQFQQVLLNLVVNAAESYKEPAGTVSVSLARDGARLKLEVSDQGCGMDRQTQQRMFDPYFTTKPGGHGLGLAAVKGVVDKFGGQLGCRSEPGHGTTFTLWFETTVPGAPSTRVVTPMPPEQASKAILVVDDDDLVREMTVAMVQGLGYATEEASGGSDGLKLLLQRRSAFAAAVIDCRMKDLDGQAVLRQIRAGGDRLPVVLVSGMISNDSLTDELRDKRTRFLPKPFTQHQLGEALAAIMGQSSSDSSSRLASHVASHVAAMVDPGTRGHRRKSTG